MSRPMSMLSYVRSVIFRQVLTRRDIAVYVSPENDCLCFCSVLS